MKAQNDEYLHLYVNLCADFAKPEQQTALDETRIIKRTKIEQRCDSSTENGLFYSSYKKYAKCLMYKTLMSFLRNTLHLLLCINEKKKCNNTTS